MEIRGSRACFSKPELFYINGSVWKGAVLKLDKMRKSIDAHTTTKINIKIKRGRN